LLHLHEKSRIPLAHLQPTAGRKLYAASFKRRILADMHPFSPWWSINNALHCPVPQLVRLEAEMRAFSQLIEPDERGLPGIFRARGIH
jgi:hypothetical protein